MYTVGFTYDGKRVRVPAEAYMALGAFVLGIALSRTAVPERLETGMAFTSAVLGVGSALLFGAAVGSGIGGKKKG